MANLNLNNVVLGGRLTADVELKQTPGGVPVCSFTLAIDRRGQDKQKVTDFIDCVAWRGTAEFISRYFSKGSCLCIIGTIQKRQWTDNHGNKRYATEIVAEKAFFVDNKNDTQGSFVPPGYIADDLAVIENDADLPF